MRVRVRVAGEGEGEGAGCGCGLAFGKGSAFDFGFGLERGSGHGQVRSAQVSARSACRPAAFVNAICGPAGPIGPLPFVVALPCASAGR